MKPPPASKTKCRKPVSATTVISSSSESDLRSPSDADSLMISGAFASDASVLHRISRDASVRANVLDPETPILRRPNAACDPVPATSSSDEVEDEHHEDYQPAPSTDGDELLFLSILFHYSRFTLPTPDSHGPNVAAVG